MIVLTRFSVTEVDASEFQVHAADALAALSERPGFLDGRLSRAVDDPTRWLLVTEWAGVGAWRRALSGYDVKLRATPLLARSLDEPSAYEDLIHVDETGTTTTTSDRASDAGSVGVGEAAGPG